MADKKQYWKDALQAAKPEGSGSDDDSYQRQQKKQARLMYNKRVLEKDIKKYIKSKKGVIHGADIERIGRKYGFYVN